MTSGRSTGVAAERPLLLGIDVGGTFTDVVVQDARTGEILVDKVASTPEDQSRGVLEAIHRLRDVHDLDLDDLRLFAHGSTVATNALLEMRLPRTALVVTEGFADVLSIGEQIRTDTFDLRYQQPEPVIAREDVLTLAERVDREGAVVRPLDDEEIERVVGLVAEAGFEACAISLLFSFRNPEHERRLAAALRRRIPGLTVALSSTVAPEIKEYPRTSTTAICAAVQPPVSRYLAGIRNGLQAASVDGPLFIMHSSGGVMSADEAAEQAHRMLLSGPAAGVLGAAQLAGTAGYANQITFDMGGTSTDICLISDGRPTLEREPHFDGRPLRVSQLDIHTIGSGGGSLAWVSAGLLHVGPQSAGAQPGPACYGRGGTLPTVTDAHVVLGRVDPGNFLGGEMALDADAAHRAVHDVVAGPLGMTVDEAALGILDVADAQMARGIRVVSVNRGFDPRDFTLVGYGGAGPMHAWSAGLQVGVGAVLIPGHPGAFSAHGLVSAEIKYDLVRSVQRPVAGLSAADAEGLYAPLLADGRARLATIDASAATRLVRVARFRYPWQDNDVEVLLGEDPLDDASLADGIARFHEQHAFQFGYSNVDDAVELIAVSIEAYGSLRREHATLAVPAGRPGRAPVAGHRPVCFRETGFVETPVYDRSELTPGATLSGPAIVEEREATTVIGPRAVAEADAGGNLLMTVRTEGGAA